jgi:adenylyl- and sulfurtransferase ThiI
MIGIDRSRPLATFESPDLQRVADFFGSVDRSSAPADDGCVIP